MPLTNARRPKYERQDVKQNLFTIQLSNHRLNKIQNLIKEKNVDSLLIIIGIDGRFNSGSLEVFNYLLFDVYSTRRDDIDRSKLDDDVFDDVMICVQLDEVHVCCNGANYWLLLPYISHWPGLRLHCISEIEMEDPDKVEDFKMKTFVEMTRRCNKISVSMRAPYESNNDQFDPMQLEDWPIVQSYAYDDFGKYSHENTKKGFFTLVHKVVDLSQEVNAICRQIDPVYLENVYVKILPQIESLYENIFQLIDTKCFNKQFELNEEALEEPVNSYYSHYKAVRIPNLDKIKMCPFVLIGTNTRKDILWNKMVNRSQNHSNKIVKNPKHLIIQCVSLQSGIVITRTAFLKCSTSNQRQKHSFIDDNTRKLSKAYMEIVNTTKYVTDCIMNDKKLNMDIDGEKYLKAKLGDMHYSDCIFRIYRINDYSQRDCSMIIVQGAVFDIMNKFTEENLGSVMFADTFTISSLPLKDDEDLNAVLRIGKGIPIFNYWMDQRLSDLHNAISEVYHTDSFGTENVDIFIPNDNFHEDSTYNACCTFYPDRVLLFNRRIGASLISPQSIEIFEGESYGDWTICTVNFDKNELSSNWIWNSNEQSSLHMVFTNHSNARKFIMNGIIPKWKDTIPITYVEKIRCPFLAESWANIQLWMINCQLPDSDVHGQSIIDGISDELSRSSLAKSIQSINNSVTNKKSCLRIFSQLMELSYSLHYLNTDNNITKISKKNPQFYECLRNQCSTVPIMEHGKFMNLENRQIQIDSGSAIVVTVLCGLPGSGHDLVSRRITKLIKEDISWILVNALTLESIPSVVEAGISRFCKLEVTDEHKQMRMIFMAPPMCSPLIVCEILTGLSTKLPLEIGSTCFCIDPRTAYLDENELTIPGLLDMCNEGWVNCILLTGTDDNSKQTNNLHRLLQSRNNLCTIFRTPRAEVNKELDTILSPVTFQQRRFASSRITIASTPIGKVSGLSGVRMVAPELFEVTFNLCGNLMKENIISTCKDIFKNIQYCPFDRNIYFIDGIFGVEEDSKHIYSFLAVSLTTQISFVPMKPKPRGDDYNYLRVYTVNLDFNQSDPVKIANWRSHLLSLIHKFQRHPPEKKVKLSMTDVTKNVMDEIHKLRHLDALPEGWFYNGLTFVHMDGTKNEKHPRLNDFIEEFLTKENNAIDEYNSAIDKMSFSDSFCKF